MRSPQEATATRLLQKRSNGRIQPRLLAGSGKTGVQRKSMSLDDVIAGLRGNDVGGSANSSAAGSGFGMLVYSWGYRVLCFLFLGLVVLKGIVVLLDKKVMSNSYILNTQSLNIKPFSLTVKTRDPKPYSPTRVQECIL